MAIYVDTTGDGYYDSEITESGGFIVQKSGTAVSPHQKTYGSSPDKIQAQIKAVAQSLRQTHGWTISASNESTGLGKATPQQQKTEELAGSTETVGELGLGAESIKMEDIQGKTPTEAAELLFSTKYNSTVPKDYADKAEFIQFLVSTISQMPKPEEIDTEQEGFLTEEQRISEERTGLAYEAAGDVYGAAGDVYGASQEAYMLGERGAERGLGTALGSLQEKAYEMGQVPTTGAGARGRMRGQKKLKGGVEDIYGGFQESMAGLKGTKERAESAYERAGSAYGRAGDAYDLSMDASQLTYDIGYTGLKEGVESKWETDFSTYLTTLPEAS